MAKGYEETSCGIFTRSDEVSFPSAAAFNMAIRSAQRILVDCKKFLKKSDKKWQRARWNLELEKTVNLLIESLNMNIPTACELNPFMHQDAVPFS